jgi:hypothetical protein
MRAGRKSFVTMARTRKKAAASENRMPAELDGVSARQEDDSMVAI